MKMGGRLGRGLHLHSQALGGLFQGPKRPLLGAASECPRVLGGTWPVPAIPPAPRGSHLPHQSGAAQLLPMAVLCQASSWDCLSLRVGPGVRAGQGVWNHLLPLPLRRWRPGPGEGSLPADRSRAVTWSLGFRVLLTDSHVLPTDKFPEGLAWLTCPHLSFVE